jgi:hypothetical protein
MVTELRRSTDFSESDLERAQVCRKIRWSSASSAAAVCSGRAFIRRLTSH